MTWSVAVTPPRREFYTRDLLRRLGVESRAFKIVRRVACRGRVVDRVVPAFPSYLFVFRALDRWALIRNFAAFVMVGERPATIEEDAMAMLSAQANADGVIAIPVDSAFKKGDRVVIRGSSSLSGQPAVFVQASANGRTIVLIDWMGRWVPVGIDERDLELETVLEATRRGRPGTSNPLAPRPPRGSPRS